MVRITLMAVLVIAMAMTAASFAGERTAMTITKNGAELSSYTVSTSQISAPSDYLTLAHVSWGSHQGIEITIAGLPLMAAGVEIKTSAGKSWVPTPLTQVGKTAKVAMPLSEGAIVFFNLRQAGTEDYFDLSEVTGNYYLLNGYKDNRHDVSGPIAGFRYQGGKAVPLE